MARKFQKILVVLGIGSATLFQAAGCDSTTSQLLQGVQDGYTSVTGTNLFEDLGKQLAGGLGSSSTTGSTQANNSSYGGGTPYAYAYSGFQPNSYWGW